MNHKTEISDLGGLLSPNLSQLELMPTLFSFAVCVIMSFIVRDVYLKRSFSLTGKSHVGSIIPILSAVVFLVIVVVKSSLALSLGLVGALSIVRFRTPIKEPEELVYLFLAISIGLGYAAGHILITTVLSLSILFIIYFWLSNRTISKTSEYNLVIDWSNRKLSFEEIHQKISSFSQNTKLIRLDTSPSESTAVLLVVPDENSFIDLITDELHKLDREISISFFEAKVNW